METSGVAGGSGSGVGVVAGGAQAEESEVEVPLFAMSEPIQLDDHEQETTRPSAHAAHTAEGTHGPHGAGAPGQAEGSKERRDLRPRARRTGGTPKAYIPSFPSFIWLFPLFTHS